jgi:hypothetical protein
LDKKEALKNTVGHKEKTQRQTERPNHTKTVSKIRKESFFDPSPSVIIYVVA